MVRTFLLLCMLKTLAVDLLLSVQLTVAYQCCKHGGPPLSLHSHHRTQLSAPVLLQLGVRVWTVVSLL